MVTRISADQKRFLGRSAVILAWYFASALVYVGAGWLTSHWVAPSTRYAVLRLDGGTFSGLAIWLAGLALLLFMRRFVDRPIVQLLTSLPSAVSWYACSAMTMDWFNDEFVGEEASGSLAGFAPAQGAQWWFYLLKIFLIGMPAVVWLLSFRPAHRRAKSGSSYQRFAAWWNRSRRWTRDEKNIVDFLSEMQGAGILGPRGGPKSNPPPDGEAPPADEDGERSRLIAEESRFRADLKILGLKKGVTREEIRDAYRALVQVWHPDRLAQNPGLRGAAQNRMSEINAAHDRIEKYLSNSPLY
jgi:hypothetical protein